MFAAATCATDCVNACRLIGKVALNRCTVWGLVSVREGAELIDEGVVLSAAQPPPTGCRGDSVDGAAEPGHPWFGTGWGWPQVGVLGLSLSILASTCCSGRVEQTHTLSVLTGGVALLSKRAGTGWPRTGEMLQSDLGGSVEVYGIETVLYDTEGGRLRSLFAYSHVKPACVMS